MSRTMSLLFAVLSYLSVTCGGVNPRIVGGQEVQPPFSLPWMSAIVYANKPSSFDGQVCGGMIIGPRHILTAAHCADPNKNGPHMQEALAVEAGRHDLSTPHDEENAPHSARNRVLEIHRHVPRHDLHDVAVLVLEREYPREVYSSVVLNQDTTLSLKTGLQVTSVGWGAMDVPGKQYPRKLQTIDLQVLDHAQCERWYHGYNRVQDFEFCAGYGGKDTCFGDSGGPTFQLVNGSYVLLGIESWGAEKCALSNRPGVRASVAHHYDFIQSILGNTVAPTSMPPIEAPLQCQPNAGQGWWATNLCKQCNRNGPCGRQCADKCSSGCLCIEPTHAPPQTLPQCSANSGTPWLQGQCNRRCDDRNTCLSRYTHWCAHKCSASCACNQGGRLLSADRLV